MLTLDGDATWGIDGISRVAGANESVFRLAYVRDDWVRIPSVTRDYEKIHQLPACADIIRRLTSGISSVSIRSFRSYHER